MAPKQRLWNRQRIPKCCSHASLTSYSSPFFRLFQVHDVALSAKVYPPLPVHDFKLGGARRMHDPLQMMLIPWYRFIPFVVTSQGIFYFNMKQCLEAWALKPSYRPGLRAVDEFCLLFDAWQFPHDNCVPISQNSVCHNLLWPWHLMATNYDLLMQACCPPGLTDNDPGSPSKAQSWAARGSTQQRCIRTTVSFVRLANDLRPCVDRHCPL